MALQNTKHFRYICLSEQLEPHLAYLSKQLHLRPRVKLKRVNLSRLKEAPDFSIPEVKDFLLPSRGT
ncbi:hypothetical protein [uncultured Cohaesibacter sp.]|uniref:hypothetical protein n=1 Tax=uncultured Cohaesibacter sp. TaxID=1002546 RepID=UPI0029C83F7F|nr:hypothetical protein [uncultured Cohaesibacter sp.]